MSIFQNCGKYIIEKTLDNSKEAIGTNAGGIDSIKLVVM